MLKQRVITAVTLVAVLLLALLNENRLYWYLLVNVVVLLAFWEWLRFCGLTALLPTIFSFALFASSLVLSQSGFLAAGPIIFGACLLWVMLLLFTFTRHLQFFHQPWLKMVCGVLVLSAAGWLVIQLQSLVYGVWWVACFLVAVFAADIGAYFVGRKYGKIKLAPSISPGKTVEGFLGGLALVLVLFFPILFTLFAPLKALTLLITVLVTAVVSVGGDLFESTLKRHAGLKDSSQILPGHGGVLDRIDSIIAAAPFFMLGLYLLGYVV